jgi:hypothetical protein
LFFLNLTMTQESQQRLLFFMLFAYHFTRIFNSGTKGRTMEEIEEFWLRESSPPHPFTRSAS